MEKEAEDVTFDAEQCFACTRPEVVVPVCAAIRKTSPLVPFPVREERTAARVAEVVFCQLEH